MSLEELFPITRLRRQPPLRPPLSSAIFIAQNQPFLHFVTCNPSRINTSEKFTISRISLIRNDFNSTRINTSGTKDLKSIVINTSGNKDLKSFRINTSKKQGRGGVGSKWQRKSKIQTRQFCS
jgi:hypothetical protein